MINNLSVRDELFAILIRCRHLRAESSTVPKISSRRSPLARTALVLVTGHAPHAAFRTFSVEPPAFDARSLPLALALAVTISAMAAAAAAATALLRSCPLRTTVAIPTWATVDAWAAAAAAALFPFVLVTGNAATKSAAIIILPRMCAACAAGLAVPALLLWPILDTRPPWITRLSTTWDKAPWEARQDPALSTQATPSTLGLATTSILPALPATSFLPAWPAAPVATPAP